MLCRGFFSFVRRVFFYADGRRFLFYCRRISPFARWWQWRWSEKSFSFLFRPLFLSVPHSSIFDAERFIFNTDLFRLTASCLCLCLFLRRVPFFMEAVLLFSGDGSGGGEEKSLSFLVHPLLLSLPRSSLVYAGEFLF